MDGKCIFKEFLLFLDVDGLETGSHRRTRGTTSVEDVATVVVLCCVQQRLKTRLGEAPGTSVQRLLLAPDDGLGVGVLVQVLTELLPGEGVELLNTRDGHVVDLVLGAVLVQSRIDLTRAEDHALDLLGRLDVAARVGGVGDDPAEARVAGELIQGRAGERVAE